jgi:hypothetical protein
MATRCWEPRAGAAHDPFTFTDLDARTAEVLAHCRDLRARSRQLMAKGEDLRKSSASWRTAAANRHREPQAGVAAPRGQAGRSRED